MNFTINTITFLFLILFTVLAWIGFEWYHRANYVDVPKVLVDHAAKPLPSSFDSVTLKKLYEGKDNFYDLNSQTQNSNDQ